MYMTICCFFVFKKNANVAVHAHADIQGSVYLIVFTSTHSYSVFHIMVSLGYRRRPWGGFYHRFYNKFELFDHAVQSF